MKLTFNYSTHFKDIINNDQKGKKIKQLEKIPFCTQFNFFG